MWLLWDENNMVIFSAWFFYCSWFPLFGVTTKFRLLVKIWSTYKCELPTRMSTSALMLVDHRGHHGLYDPKRRLLLPTDNIDRTYPWFCHLCFGDPNPPDWILLRAAALPRFYGSQFKMLERVEDVACIIGLKFYILFCDSHDLTLGLSTSGSFRLRWLCVFWTFSLSPSSLYSFFFGGFPARNFLAFQKCPKSSSFHSGSRTCLAGPSAFIADAQSPHIFPACEDCIVNGGAGALQASITLCGQLTLCFSARHGSHCLLFWPLPIHSWKRVTSRSFWARWLSISALIIAILAKSIRLAAPSTFEQQSVVWLSLGDGNGVGRPNSITIRMRDGKLAEEWLLYIFLFSQ